MCVFFWGGGGGKQIKDIQTWSEQTGKFLRDNLPTNVCSVLHWR